MKLNTPNKITISRIALIVFVIFFYLASFFPFAIGKFVALFVFALATYTDHLDGYIARKTNQVTTLGKFLDPIADKLLVFSALVLLCVDGTLIPIFAELVLILMLSRDFIVGALRQVAASENVIISADKMGKLKTVVQDVALTELLLYSSLKELASVVSVSSNLLFVLMLFGHILIGLATIISVVSGFNYIIKNKEVFKGK